MSRLEEAVSLDCRIAETKIPWVASAACWRKTVEFAVVVGFVVTDVDNDESGFSAGVGDDSGSWRTSIGIFSRWHAKIEFMMGMY